MHYREESGHDQSILSCPTICEGWVCRCGNGFGRSRFLSCQDEWVMHCVAFGDVASWQIGWGYPWRQGGEVGWRQKLIVRAQRSS